MPKRSRTHWDEDISASENARRELPPLVAGYFAKVRRLLAKDPSAAKLHGLRLATKRLRYTLELFRACYGPGLETRIAELRRIQQVLGDLNDHVAAGRLLSKKMSASSQREMVKSFLDGRIAGLARDFRKHWADVFDSPGREQWWTGYLARHGRPPARRV